MEQCKEHVRKGYGKGMEKVKEMLGRGKEQKAQNIQKAKTELASWDEV